MSRLREIRLSKNISQTLLAALSIIPQSHISAFESGARPLGIERATRLAQALGVSVEDILEPKKEKAA